MELTVAMLDWLIGKRYGTQLPQGLADQRITHLVLGKADAVRPDVLQILHSLQQDNRNLSIIITPEEDPAANGWVLFQEEDSWMEVVNYIFTCFQEFRTWREEMRVLSGVQVDVQSLIDLASRYLNVDVILIGQSHDVLAQSEYSLDPQKEELLHLLHIRDPQKDELIEELYLHDPEFDKTFQTDGLTRYQFGALHNHEIYYANIRMDGVFLARVLWLVRTDLRHSGFTGFLELATPLIDSCYRQKYTRELQTKHNDQVSRVIRNLISGVALPEQEVSQPLTQLGWSLHDRYQVIVLQTAGYIHSEQTLNYYANQLCANFGSFLSLVIGDSILCVRNLEIPDRKDLRNALTYFLRENIFRAGFSEEFEDLLNCRQAWEQANAALRLGQRQHPDLWRYDFSEYLYEYIMELIGKELGTEGVCPAGLKLIRSYDAQKPTAQLEKTLRTYLACHLNASEAAARLFIHRTTFLYRMSKIEQISGLSTTSWKDLVMLMLAFSVDSDG